MVTVLVDITSTAEPITDHLPLTPNCRRASNKLTGNLNSRFVSKHPPLHDRPLDGRAPTQPTAPHARHPSNSIEPTSLAIPIGLNRPYSSDHYAVTPPPPKRDSSAAARTTGAGGSILQSPFRKLAADATTRRPRGHAARLWNPSNSTPRVTTHRRKPSKQPKQRGRRASTPPPPSIPLDHPELDSSADANDPTGTATGDYPLLTLPQRLQLRDTSSNRSSLQAERRASNDKRVSLPGSVRASYDGRRSQGPTPTVAEFPDEVKDSCSNKGPTWSEKGKDKMAAENQNQDGQSYSRDLERGPDVMDHRQSTASIGDGIGSAISSSNSSIMGEDVHADDDAWGPQHPCYPHLNPHVPIESPEYTSTRIIRVKRDWLVMGDLAPTFSNLYPEILDPAGLSEQEFRRIVEKLNCELIPVFNPYTPRNIVDGVLGVVTGWLWDDMGLSSAKGRLNKLEKWIEDWNQTAARTMGTEGSIMAPKLIPLRRTGYMSLDIQIPDPEIAAAPTSTSGAGGSASGLPLEPAPVATPA